MFCCARAHRGRGSDSPNTGPIRDHSSFSSNTVAGAFAYIDAAAPRRPNDVAQIVSQETLNIVSDMYRQEKGNV